ncbi:hypothetical protein Bca4012_037780 [Brassica carinata]
MGDKRLTVRCTDQETMQQKPKQESMLLHMRNSRLLFRKTNFHEHVTAGPSGNNSCVLTQVVTEDYLKDDVEDMRQEG